MELKDQLKLWVREYCNDDFKDDNGEDDFPAGVELFIAQTEKYLANQKGIKSEMLGDYQVTFEKELPVFLTNMLNDYRKLRWRK